MIDESAMSSPALAAIDSTPDIAARLATSRPRLIRLARLRGVPSDQAEDLVQETLLTAWRALGRLRNLERFDAWLDGILRNHCRRYAGAQASEAAPLSALGALDAPADEFDPLDDLTQQELAALIDAALGYLREGARQALELRYLGEMPPAEVAARLGVTLNTLDARLSRARRQLRETLNGPLRERAVEFGLALAPADESGWRDSRLWCHFCGKTRMLGILEDAPDGEGARMALRCPRCYQRAGVIEADIPSCADLRGLTSFRPAMRRLMKIAFEIFPQLLIEETLCFTCRSPRRAQAMSGEALPGQTPMFRDHYYIVANCPICSYQVNGAATIAGRADPRIMDFIMTRQRWILEPERLTTYDSAPAIRFSLYDLATDERLIYFADPQTLDLRGVHDH